MLDKSKTQTIRLAWINSKKIKEKIKKANLKIKNKNIGDIFAKDLNNHLLAEIEKAEILGKPPRYKVGDKVKLLWNQRSKYKFFFRKNGLPALWKTLDECPKSWNKRYNRPTTDKEKKIFYKYLGNAEITEVFKIEMWIGNDVPLISGFSLKESKKLAKIDGFSDYNSFIKWFNKYNLSIPKQFWVYRWRWL